MGEMKMQRDMKNRVIVIVGFWKQYKDFGVYANMVSLGLRFLKKKEWKFLVINLLFRKIYI